MWEIHFTGQYLTLCEILTGEMYKSFLCQGSNLWASLDGRLKDSRTKSLFKTRLKINCIDNY